MFWQYFDIVRFDFGSVIQGHMRVAEVKRPYNSLILAPNTGDK